MARMSPQKDSMRKRLIRMAENYEESTGEEVWLHFGPSSPSKRPMSLGDLSLSKRSEASPQVQLLSDSAACLDSAVSVLAQYTGTFKRLVGQLGESVQSLQRTLRDLEEANNGR